MVGRIWTQRTAAHVIAMVVVILGGLVVGRTTSTAHAYVDMGSPLAVTTRTSLQTCAQVAPQLREKNAQILNQLSQRMQTLRNTHPKWKEAHGPTTAAPPFNSNCTIKIPTARLDASDATAVGRGTVTDPSPFRAIVLVLDDQTANTVLGPLNISHAPYEMMQINEHEATEVTNALVVRESFISHPDFVNQYLSVAVGLEPIKPYALPAGETSPTVKPNGYDAGQ